MNFLLSFWATGFVLFNSTKELKAYNKNEFVSKNVMLSVVETFSLAKN
ncbi:hypothetical protein ELBR111191_02960 [Elizabethkingia bruuniana]